MPIPLRSSRVFLLWCLLLVAATGCAPYSRVGETFQDSRTKLTVTLPPDWLRFGPDHDAYTMTRDGLRLERISLFVKRVGAKLPKTARTYRSGMLPFEVAELSLGLIEAGGAANNFKIDAIELANVAGREGYRADGRFVDDQGLPLRFRVYGVLLPEAVCEFRYVAEQSVYFDKYLPVFERVVSSARLAER